LITPLWLRLARTSALADAVDAPIGFHFDEEEISSCNTDKVGFDIGDFDGRSAANSHRRLQQGRGRPGQCCGHHPGSHEEFSASHWASRSEPTAIKMTHQTFANRRMIKAEWPT
jgi:hypothetical protein